jgi:hypothetical protein
MHEKDQQLSYFHAEKSHRQTAKIVELVLHSSINIRSLAISNSMVQSIERIYRSVSMDENAQQQQQRNEDGWWNKLNRRGGAEEWVLAELCGRGSCWRAEAARDRRNRAKAAREAGGGNWRWRCRWRRPGKQETRGEADGGC